MRPENMQTPETPRGSGSGLDIEKIIDRAVNTAVNSTVIKLKMSGLMKDDRKTAYQKTEELLRNYNIFRYLRYATNFLVGCCHYQGWG